MSEKFENFGGSRGQTGEEGNLADQERDFVWSSEKYEEERERLNNFLDAVEKEIEKSGPIDFLRPGFWNQLCEAENTVIPQFPTSPNFIPPERPAGVNELKWPCLISSAKSSNPVKSFH